MIATINGVRIYYEIEGQGVPCLILHGGLGIDHAYLRPWFSPLADKARLIFYDQRGNGKSSRLPTSEYTHRNLVEDANALRRYLGLTKIAMIGHSYGAIVALMFALKYQDYLSHLVLISGAASWHYLIDARTRVNASRDPELIRGFETVEGGQCRTNRELKEASRRTRFLYYHATSRVPEMSFHRSLDRIYSAKVQRHLILHEMPKFDVRKAIKTITTPTLILAGRFDIITPPKYSRELHRGIKGSKLIVFENSGHMCFEEENGEFIAVLRSFLFGESPRRRTPIR